MSNDDIVVFENTKLSDLFKEIHNRSDQKKEIIGSVIDQITKLITTSDSAMMLAPILKEFFEVGVKNDEQLVKLATIVQRLVATEQTKKTDEGEGLFLSAEERNRLIENTLGDVKISEKTINSDLKEASEKLSKIIS